MRLLWAGGVLLFTSVFAPAQVRMVPEPDARGVRALNALTDILGQEVTAQGEPSFDRVARYFPAMKRPRVTIGVRYHPDQFGVGWDGGLITPKSEYLFRLGEPPSPYSLDGPVTRSLLDRYLPVLESRWRHAGLDYEETVFGYSENLSPQAPLSAYVRFRVKNPGKAELPARISVYTAPATGGPVPAQAAKIPPAGEHSFYFRIPFQLDPEHIAESPEAAEFESALAEVRKSWTETAGLGMTVRTPERRVNEAYRAWLLFNNLNVKRTKDQYEIHDGAGFYDQIYGYSAALYCHALSLYGDFDDAEKYLGSMLAAQHEDGLYMTPDFGMPDNGALLFALGQQYRLSRRGEWFRGVAPKMIKGCEWIRSNREKTKTSEGGRKALTYGMLPPAQSYCDYRQPVYSYYSDSYNWMGMHETGLALKEAGMSEQGDLWLKEAADYRNDILSSMERAAIDVGGGLKGLPVEPVTQRLIKQGAEHYYALVAPSILETELFGVRDQRAAWITRFLEERGGLLLGLARIWDGVDHAYTYGYALTELRNGEVPKSLLTFYGFLAYGMDRDTYSSVEFTRITSGINELTLPHTYSNTQQLRLLRMMLVKEEGEDLLVAPGTPAAWLDAGKTLAVTHSPTVYGLLSYSFGAEKGSRRVKGTIEPVSGTSPAVPKQLRVRIHSGLGTLADAVVNGRRYQPTGRDEIALDGSMLKARLEIVADFR
jgi:hypothetical protein